MAIATEVDFDYVNKRIKRHGSATSAIETVNALYSYMQTVFDDLAQSDDKIPMDAPTPTSYKMINGWYIEEEVIRHLSSGAIATVGYTDEIHVVGFQSSGYTNAVAGDIGKMVNDDGGDFGTLVDYDNTARKWWIRTGTSTVMATGSAVTIDDTGTGAGTTDVDSATGETLFANPYTLGTLFTSLQLYIIQDSIKVVAPDSNPWWAAGAFDILIKVTEAGTDIDSKYITVFGRKWTETYTHFRIQLTSAGQNAVPLGTADDLNVTGAEATGGALVDTDLGGTAGSGAGVDLDWSGAPYSYDIGDGNGAQNYSIQIDCRGASLADVYKACQWMTRDGSTVQLPNDGTGDDGQEYVNFNAAWAEVVAAPLGSFAGGKFFGARGVYFVNLHADDAQAFQLIDTANNPRTPPNYQAFSMGGVLSGDTVGVFKSTGEGLLEVDKSQYNLTNSNNVENALTIESAIPSSTPSTGTIIVVDADGSEIAYAYTSWTGSTFTVTVSADVYTGDEDCYVPFLYAVSGGTSVTNTTTIYTADIYVVGRVRKAGIVPYEAAGIYGSTGYSGSAIRNSDGIYN